MTVVRVSVRVSVRARGNVSVSVSARGNVSVSECRCICNSLLHSSPCHPLGGQAAGYSFIRVWGGGVVEDQQFYEYCDRAGILVQQDFPLAGCGEWAPEAGSWAWLSTPTDEGSSLMEALKLQVMR